MEVRERDQKDIDGAGLEKEDWHRTRDVVVDRELEVEMDCG